MHEARFEGLVTHLFALRAFLPEAIGDAHVRHAVDVARGLLRDELDRLFIKLRLPSYAMAARDVETPSLRSTIDRFLHDAARAHAAFRLSRRPQRIELRGSFDPAEVRELAERLSGAELATALPWAALARFLPDETPQYAHYRELLVERLDRFAESDRTEFIDALQHRRRQRSSMARSMRACACVARKRVTTLRSLLMLVAVSCACGDAHLACAAPPACNSIAVDAARSCNVDRGRGRRLRAISPNAARCDLVFAVAALDDDRSRQLLLACARRPV